MTSMYVYAALLLHKAGRPIDEIGIYDVLAAAGIVVDTTRVKQLLEVLKDVDITEVLRNVQTATVFRQGEQEGTKVEIAKVEADLTKKKDDDDDNDVGLGQLFGDA